MTHNDQLFSNMHAAALGRLRDCRPQDISSRADVAFDGRHFHLKSLGQDIHISYSDYSIRPQLPSWQALTILHYLARADGTPLSGVPIPFAQHENGMVRGGGFDREAEKTIAAQLGKLSEEDLRCRIHRLGGKIIPGKADLSAVLDYLPNYPVYLNIWFADEEFPASGRMFLDASAPII